MSFDDEGSFPAFSDDVPNDVVDLMQILPVEQEGYEDDPVLVVNGMVFDGSAAFDDGEGWDDAPLVPIDQLFPVEEEPSYPCEWQRDDGEEEARRRFHDQVNDAYARADAAWSYDEAEEILDANLPPGSGLFDGGWL